MELHEEVRRARTELGLSQGRLAELCGIQRRQLSILERGGNVTLSTLRKVVRFLPNLEQFTFEQIRMKPTYIDYPPFEWTLFYQEMGRFQQALEELNTTFKAWLANPPSADVPPELLEKRTTTIATEILQAYARLIDPEGKELAQEEQEEQGQEAGNQPIDE